MGNVNYCGITESKRYDNPFFLEMHLVKRGKNRTACQVAKHIIGESAPRIGCVVRFSTWRSCTKGLNSAVLSGTWFCSMVSGCSAAWLARYLGVVEVVGSNPASQIFKNPMILKESSGFFVCMPHLSGCCFRYTSHTQT